MKKIIIALAAATAFTGTAFAADIMDLPASMGKVPFPHKQHQESVKDCKVCHSNGTGKIPELNKEWAHKTCKGCHTETKKGPTSCKDCHKK